MSPKDFYRANLIINPTGMSPAMTGRSNASLDRYCIVGVGVLSLFSASHSTVSVFVVTARGVHTM